MKPACRGVLTLSFQNRVLCQALLHAYEQATRENPEMGTTGAGAAGGAAGGAIFYGDPNFQE